jgi:release factor glutamine methyltransferase
MSREKSFQRPTTVRSLLLAAEQRLAAVGIASARLDAKLLLADALGVETGWLFTHPEFIVADDAPFLARLERREKREPISHILGKREFWSREFIVGPAVLDPRPDSETLIAAILKRLPDHQAPLRLLDLGTGSGCLLLTLLGELPKAVGLGLDQSEEALATARLNAEKLELVERVEFQKGDWNLPLSLDRFEIVLSNPPYIPSADIAGLEEEVRLYEPLAALDGGMDGLDAYRAIIGQLPSLLKPGGLVAFELGIGQEQAVARLLEAAGLQNIESEKDLAGIPRCLLGFAASHYTKAH